MKKVTPTRVILPEEAKLDEQLKDTHEKKVFSFTEQEKSDLHTIELMTSYLKMIEQIKQNQVLVDAFKRVGRNLTPELPALFNLKDGVFVCYEPKK